jgi:hypothetical protein
MCKTNIETAASIRKGVSKAVWDKDKQNSNPHYRQFAKQMPMPFLKTLHWQVTTTKNFLAPRRCLQQIR